MTGGTMTGDANGRAPGSFTYEEIADNYASVVDVKPWNAAYERPAMMALLPELDGRPVLDVGCGSGWYAEQLLARGAELTAFDNTPRMVELTRARVGDRGRVLIADLAAPLPFEWESFEVIVAPLVLHYVEDWGAMLAELRRVLTPGGMLLFSTHHPCSDAERNAPGGYFATAPVEEVWSGIGRVRFHHRSLTSIVEALADAGFLIERMVEPRPTEAFRAADPGGFERLERFPAFLLIRALKVTA